MRAGKSYDQHLPWRPGRRRSFRVLSPEDQGASGAPGAEDESCPGTSSEAGKKGQSPPSSAFGFNSSPPWCLPDPKWGAQSLLNPSTPILISPRNTLSHTQKEDLIWKPHGQSGGHTTSHRHTKSWQDRGNHSGEGVKWSRHCGKQIQNETDQIKLCTYRNTPQ